MRAVEDNQRLPIGAPESLMDREVPTAMSGGGDRRSLLIAVGRTARVLAAAHVLRVCQAWHRTSEVQVGVPGMRGAEGEEQGQGVHREVGFEGSPIHMGGATPRNRLRGVAPPGRAGPGPRSPPSAGGVREQSGVDAWNVRGLPLGELPVVRVNGA